MPSTAPDQLDRLYQSARARWPRVAWDKTAFSEHLGGEPIKFPVDLYLGGAAGWRLASAWETIQTDLGPQAQRVLKRQPISDYAVEDLWAETVAKLMEADARASALSNGQHPARIIHYRARVTLLNYLILVAKRLAIHRQRRAKQLLQLDSVEGENQGPRDVPDRNAAAPDAEQLEAEQAALMQKSLADAYGTLSPEQQFLIAMVYRQGMKRKDAGKLLGWSPFKTTRSLAAAMSRLRESLTDLQGVNWTAAMASAWEKCVNQQCWKQTDELQVTDQRASEPVRKGNSGSPVAVQGVSREHDEPTAKQQR